MTFSQIEHLHRWTISLKPKTVIVPEMKLINEYHIPLYFICNGSAEDYEPWNVLGFIKPFNWFEQIFLSKKNNSHSNHGINTELRHKPICYFVTLESIQFYCFKIVNLWTEIPKPCLEP